MIMSSFLTAGEASHHEVKMNSFVTAHSPALLDVVMLVCTLH